MAIVKFALYSFGASGTVARIITFNQSLTKQVARRRPRTKRKPTTSQKYIRQRFADAATSWRGQTIASKAEWKVVSQLSGKNTFAKYVKEWYAQSSTLATPPFIPMR